MRAIDVLSSSLNNDAKHDDSFNGGDLFRQRVDSEQPPEFDVDVDTNHIPKQLSNVSTAYDFDALFKFLVIGDKGVGKTSVVQRLLDGDNGEYRDAHYVEEQKMHLQHGIDFKVKKRLYLDDKSIEVHLYDIIDVSQTQLTQRALLSYIDNVSAILLVFDLCDKHSFNSIKKKWLPLVHGSANQHLHKVIIANDAQVGAVVAAPTTAEHDACDIFQSAMPGSGSGSRSGAAATRDKYERMANEMECEYFQMSSRSSGLDILGSIVCALCEPKMVDAQLQQHTAAQNAPFLASQPYHPYRGPPNSQRTLRRGSGSSYTLSLDQMVSPSMNDAEHQSKVPMYADTIQEEDSMHYNHVPFPGPMFVRDSTTSVQQQQQQQHDTMAEDTSSTCSTNHTNDTFALSKQKITIKLADGINRNNTTTMRLQQEEEEDDDEETEDDDEMERDRVNNNIHSQHQQYTNVAVVEDDDTDVDVDDNEQQQHHQQQQAGDGGDRRTGIADCMPFKFEYSRKISEQGVYSLNEFQSSTRISCKTFSLMFVKVLFFPFTMLYQLLLFHHNNDDKLIHIALRSHLPPDFDVYDAKMRIFYDLQDAFLRRNYFDENVQSTDILFDSTDFLKQSTKQIVVRFACICVGLLLFVLMILNLIWFGLHHHEATLHAMECMGAVYLWLLYAFALSLWVCVDCRVNSIDKRQLGRTRLLVHQNKYDTEAVTNTSASRLLRYIDDKRAREHDASSSVYRGACMEIVCLSLALCYALLPSFARTSFAAFIPSDSVGVGIWLISFLTNYVASLLLVRLCLISLPRTFERIAYLNSSLTCLVSMSHQNEAHTFAPLNWHAMHAVYLPFLNVMTPTNIASFQQLRNYVFLCCAQKMKSIEVLVMFYLLIFIALCLLLLFCGAQSVYRWVCCFWIVVGFTGLCALFRAAYAMHTECKQQSKELLSQTLFVNHQMLSRKYRESDVGGNNTQLARKRMQQDSKHAAHILHSVRLLIAYLDANPVTPMLCNIKLYHVIACCALLGSVIILIAIS